MGGIAIEEMTNWKDELITETEGEAIIAINIEGILYNKDNLDTAMKRLDQEFDGGYGVKEGLSFWAWTESTIYFCGVYDGAEWLDELPRNPTIEIPHHVGGE